MRVLIACDGIAGLGPRATSEVVGKAFAAAGAQVAVAPLGGGGAAFAVSASSFDPGATVASPDHPDEFEGVVGEGIGRLYLDLTSTSPAGVVEGFTAERLAALTSRLAGRDVVAVVPDGDDAAPLTGLTGAVARAGRDAGHDLARTLADDEEAAAWAQGIGVDPQAPGSGAVGGLGAVVQALGGRVSTGLAEGLAGLRVPDVARRADLLVTGAQQLDFHTVGGPVVRAIAAAGEQALRPVVAVAGRCFVSARELRLSGIESAHPLAGGLSDEEPTPQRLAAVARGVAETWRL